MTMKSGATDCDRIGSSLRRIRRLASGRSSLWASLLAILSLTFVLAASSPSGSGIAEEPKFKHSEHVSYDWYKGIGPEYVRDCRGCHAFGAKGSEPGDPQAVCANCHFGPQSWHVVTTPGNEVHLPRNPSSVWHPAHENLACRACHFVEKGTSKDLITANTGLSSCNECHGDKSPPTIEAVVIGPGQEKAKFDQGVIGPKFVEALNNKPELKKEGRGPFLHGDHLSSTSLMSKEGCTKCHAGVAKSDAVTLAEQEFDTPACGDCHIQALGKPITVVKAAKQMKATSTAAPTKPTSTAALTFDHKDHLDVGAHKDKNGSAAGFDQIKNRGCLACHVHDAASRPETFGLIAGRDKYKEGCVKCHDTERFQSKTHGNWGVCDACHEFGQDKMETNRPTVKVDRELPQKVTFKLPTQKHPGIVLQPGKSCEDCHRATVPELPTRIEKVHFDHAPHVEKGAGSSRCEDCHKSVVSTAESSVDIGRAWPTPDARANDVKSVLTFDEGSCQRCHEGIKVDPDSLAKREPREVLKFSHASHLKSAHDPKDPSKLVQCTTCHMVADERGKAVATPNNVMDCKLCHGHDAPRAPNTQGIGKAEVQSCDVCHDRGTPARKPATTEVARSTITLKEGQFHPSPGEQACAKCHRAVDTDVPLPAKDSGTLAKIEAVRASMPNIDMHRTERGQLGPCFQCHWYKSTGILDGAKAAKDEISADNRRDFGWRLTPGDQFPGGQKFKARPGASK